MAKKKPRLSPEFWARDAELRREVEALIARLKREAERERRESSG